MPSTMQMQSISGIITQIHSTTEEVPPALVGASVNVIDDKVYVFAGRLASSRKMTNYLYILDLHTLIWTRHIPPPDSEKPPMARYFHSTSVYKKQLIIFGGMGYSRLTNDGLCVLDDITVLDVETMCWITPNIQPSLYSPQSRYAHLSSVTEDKLIVMGGQDLDNNYLDEMNVLNLKTWDWEQVKTFEKHVGAYRSIAVTAPPGTRIPSNSYMMKNEDSSTTAVDDLNDLENDASAINTNNLNGASHRTSTVRQFSSSSLQTPDEPNPIYLYTNYNFADVKRELQLIYSSAQVEDCSTFMNGSVMPPGLRFPTGHTLGNHLILAGTYLSPQSQSYTIWSLDLGKLTWSRIETGTVFSSGSWNRGVLYENENRFIVFGNTNRSLLDDYNHRQVNFDHIAMVDLEAFGVYSLPKVTCSSLAQEMGLRLLNEPAVSDFHIITQDNLSIPVNSAVLSQRWPYFANLMKDNHEKVKSQSTSKRSSQLQPETTTVTPTQEVIEDTIKEDASVTSSLSTLSSTEAKEDQQPMEAIATKTDNIKEVTLIKSHYMSFPYPHTVVIALLQYIYTDNLLTAQQYQPHILSQLLLLSDMYDIPRLRELSTHALHQMLNMSTAPLIFETAALSHQTSLQIRALKMMIAAKKMIQQQQNLQQQQQQHVIRSRTVSSPNATLGSSIDSPPPISPTASLSSSSFNNSLEQSAGSTSRLSLAAAAASNYESNSASPTLQSFRSSSASIRKPSLSVNNRSTYGSSPSNRASTFSGATMYSPSRSTYSPPTTPHQQRSYPTSDNMTPRRSASPPPPPKPLDKPNKEKKKKKAFLEAFGKFSSSISFQNNSNNSNNNSNSNN
ncbi:hypothetical protein INT47_004447 [Mucor saturninus]|uniref:BTB domain-containing protein n=1 Tax=Mucor saturninus TaxID=64648 RepID=A0A8H7QUD2_9FUNG|nr:hypothetical protein INT47_004447 [Mucor saturninus]